ncbi:MAG: sigma-E processing peptidase SpoIIGA, partial [Clostridia bacterium]|nr:sigma-E processing peptidase SpoIIGA [Clostridia bacterium]
MNIYIEYIIIDNLIINSLILLCVKNTMKLKVRGWRLLLSASIGTAVAVLLPLFNISQLMQLPLKIVLGVIMVLVLSSYLKFKEFAISFVLFILYTILLAGASMVTLLTFGTSLEALSAGGYDIS